jgi:hypothetical protein
MAAAAILKINYTLQLPYLWSDFVQILYHSTVITSSLRKCNRKWDKRKHNMAAAAIFKINYTL